MKMRLIAVMIVFTFVVQPCTYSEDSARIKSLVEEVRLCGGEADIRRPASDVNTYIGVQFKNMELPIETVTKLSKMKEVIEIDIDNVVLSPESWAVVGKMRQIQQLFIRYSEREVSQTIMSAIVGMPQLYWLSIESPSIPLEALDKAVSPLDKLIFLRISGCTLSPNGCGAILRQCPKIEEMELEKVVADMDAISRLSTLPNLKSLNVNSSQLPAKWLGLLSRSVMLRELTLESNGVRDSDLALLASCPGLRRLYVTEGLCSFTTIDRVGQLSSLWIASEDNLDSALNDDGMAAIARLKNLKELSIRDAKMVTDRGLAALKALNKLEHLDVFLLGGTSNGISQMLDITTLREVSLWSVKWSDDCARKIAALTNLTELDLSSVYVEDASLRLIAASKNLSNLSRLHLTHVTDNGLVMLSEMKSLRRLSIGQGYSKDGIRRFKMAAPQCVVHEA